MSSARNSIQYRVSEHVANAAAETGPEYVDLDTFWAELELIFRFAPDWVFAIGLDA